ncbi:MAG: hypothetical protein LUD12_13325 [Lachnospiraceae bacterium]|nr:hypothetical protein [Lachnospiraceae bacterium]
MVDRKSKENNSESIHFTWKETGDLNVQIHGNISAVATFSPSEDAVIAAAQGIAKRQPAKKDSEKSSEPDLEIHKENQTGFLDAEESGYNNLNMTASHRYIESLISGDYLNALVFLEVLKAIARKEERYHDYQTLEEIEALISNHIKTDDTKMENGP